MARMLPQKKNPIIEAGDRLDDEAEDVVELDASDESEDDEETGSYDAEDLSADDMNEVIESLDSEALARVNATRQRGRSLRAHKPVHPGRAKQQSRNPKRDRPVAWAPADTLYAPPPREGMEQRWIRVRLGTDDDQRNFQKKFREGWKPINLDDVSEEYLPPSMEFGRFGSVVAVSDLVLCERPMQIGASRKKYFRDRLQRQLKSADRRHVNKVERDGHRIVGGARLETRAQLTRHARRGVVQDDE